MKFTKMHGCGNDYIFVNCIEKKLENPNEISLRLSDRHFGIGSDGLILIDTSKVADFKMSIFNADGSEAKMCGNGIRCVAKYVYDNGLTNNTQIKVETLSGIKTLDMIIKDTKVETVTVNMGAPIMNPVLIPVISDKEIIVSEPIAILGVEYQITCVSIGNPHCVIFVEDVKNLNLEKIGPEFEKHSMFPDRVNTEFIRVIDRKNIEMRVWERGSGETFACGTGACASVVACVLNGATEDEVLVHLLGGNLLIKYDREENIIYMTGGAEEVYVGYYEK